MLSSDTKRMHKYWKLLEIMQILTANKLLYKVSGQSTNVGRASLSSPRVTLVRNLIRKALLSLNQPPNICTTLLSWMKLLKELQFSWKCWCLWMNMKQTFQCVICKRVLSTPMFSRCCGIIRVVRDVSLAASWPCFLRPLLCISSREPVSAQNTRWSSTSFAGDRGRADHCSSCTNHCHLAVSGSSFWLRLWLWFTMLL